MQQRFAFVLSVIILICSPAFSFAASNNVLHFGVSAVCGAASESILHYKTDLGVTGRIFYGTVLGSMPGLAKEIIDSSEEGNHFSGTQMGIDVAGSFVGAVLANFINAKIQLEVESRRKKAMLSLRVEW